MHVTLVESGTVLCVIPDSGGRTYPKAEFGTEYVYEKLKGYSDSWYRIPSIKGVYSVETFDYFFHIINQKEKT